MSVGGINGLGIGGDFYTNGAEGTSGSAPTKPSADQEQVPINRLGVSDDQELDLEARDVSFSRESLESANTVCASFLGSVLALIQDMTSDMIRDNRQIVYESQMMSADTMEKQADKMRDAALISLVTGICLGVFQIGAGAAQLGTTLKGLSAISEMGKAAKAADAVDGTEVTKSYESRLTRGLNVLKDPKLGETASSML